MAGKKISSGKKSGTHKRPASPTKLRQVTSKPVTAKELEDDRVRQKVFYDHMLEVRGVPGYVSLILDSSGRPESSKITPEGKENLLNLARFFEDSLDDGRRVDDTFVSAVGPHILENVSPCIDHLSRERVLFEKKVPAKKFKFADWLGNTYEEIMPLEKEARTLGCYDYIPENVVSPRYIGMYNVHIKGVGGPGVNVQFYPYFSCTNQNYCTLSIFKAVPEWKVYTISKDSDGEYKIIIGPADDYERYMTDNVWKRPDDDDDYPEDIPEPED